MTVQLYDMEFPQKKNPTKNSHIFISFSLRRQKCLFGAWIFSLKEMFFELSTLGQSRAIQLAPFWDQMKIIPGLEFLLGQGG